MSNLSNSKNTSSETTTSNLATRLRNFIIALVAIALSVTIFIGLQTETSSVSLSEMAEDAIPLDVALSNGKPTLVEFYANWCTSCQTMAPELKEIKEEYRDNANFVMLNVDNSKWLPELTKYRVDGIPHFVFLDREGAEVGQSIGEMPKSVIAGNIEALISGNSLPYNGTVGQGYNFNAPVEAIKASQVDPRAHGSQVQ
ncbi:MAG: thioredoxin family protein [Microcoleaceae cyanobacterium MO_207.B10]|nr:thioredoxin family protein [Microcoleaceae cyanobacterium MO_207.B10]